MERIFDVAIIGAGPGGLAAARTSAQFGASVVVIDEQAMAGGQIFRQPPPVFRRDAEKFGKGYAAGVAGANEAMAISAIDWRLGQGVWSLLTPAQAGDDCFVISTTGSDGESEVRCRRLIIATGCYDMPVPFPGWTLPGVMGGGAIQAMMKGQRVLPGNNIVLAGSHPLMLIIAEQMLAFGVRPAHIVFSQPFTRAAHLLSQPVAAARSISPLLQAGRALAGIMRAKVPISFGSAVIRANGVGALDSVTLAPLDKVTGLPDRARAQDVPCDVVGISFGFTASSELVRLAGGATEWSRTGGGWIASHDGAMRSNVPGLYVAGEVAGIGGAETAAAEGRLAALSALADAGFSIDETMRRRAHAERNRNRAFARLLQALSDPGDDLIRALREAETVICRCEEITKDEIDSLLGENPFLGTSDAVKLLGRVGMGACQGRYCARSLAEIVTESTGRTMNEVGPFRARIPIKPVPLRQFAAKPPAS